MHPHSLKPRLLAAIALLLSLAVPVQAAPPSPSPVAGKPTLLIAGLSERTMGIESALKSSGIDAVRCDLQTLPKSNRLGFAPAFPSLEGVRVLVVADVPARAFGPPEQMSIRKFVENGGRLIVLGGFYGFGHGGLKGSFLEDVLPVTTIRTFDRVRVTGELTQPGGSAKLGGCAWVHEVALKKGASILWQVDGKPAVVSWKLGNGQVTVVTATVLGEPANPFWESPAWQEELARLLNPEI